MTKTDRAALQQQGKIIFRSQINKKSKWDIVQYTVNGGWIKSSPCGCDFKTREECDAVIDALAEKNSDIVKDE